MRNEFRFFAVLAFLPFKVGIHLIVVHCDQQRVAGRTGQKREVRLIEVID